MVNLVEIKQDLINRLEVLKNQYPDCVWLTECVNMNKHHNLILEMGLAPEAEELCAVISPN